MIIVDIRYNFRIAPVISEGKIKGIFEIRFCTIVMNTDSDRVPLKAQILKNKIKKGTPRL